MRTYTFVNDPGHAWLKVPLKLALQVPGISTYSYVGKAHAYLEEDCDAGRYLRAMHPDKDYRIRETYTKGRARIRNLPHFTYRETTNV